MRDAGWPVVAESALPWLTTDQMVEVDRVMIHVLGIELIQMMENAGHRLATLSQRLFDPTTVTVCAGTGGNGGGGLVAARHLANRGVVVKMCLTRPPEEFSGLSAHQLAICQRMGIEISEAPVVADVMIDALIGYSLRGEPRGRAKSHIEAMNDQDQPVVSLDVPSGLDSSAGQTPGASVSAAATLTLALPKVGLRDSELTGRLFVGDISVPPSVYTNMGLASPPAFDSSAIIEIALRHNGKQVHG